MFPAHLIDSIDGFGLIAALKECPRVWIKPEGSPPNELPPIHPLQERWAISCSDPASVTFSHNGPRNTGDNEPSATPGGTLSGGTSRLNTRRSLRVQETCMLRVPKILT